MTSDNSKKEFEHHGTKYVVANPLNKRIKQVEDDFQILRSMLFQQRQAAEVYQWSNYWKHKSNLIIEYIKNCGLKNFRIETDATPHTAEYSFRTFGATDIVTGAAPEDIMKHTFTMTQERDGARVLDLPASRAGNPLGFECNGVFLTESWLYYYMRYSYVSKFLNLDGKTIIELGSGSGKQAHLLKLAHPTATIILFDMAPQLYVANQYLKAVLPYDEFVPFEKTRDIRTIWDIEPGKVYLFGNWEFSLLRNFDFDLLWNAASFQEMEPEIVDHYFSFCDGAWNVYLMQKMSGQTVGGRLGVIKPVTYENYQKNLKNYKAYKPELAAVPQPTFPTKWKYSDHFWRKR